MSNNGNGNGNEPDAEHIPGEEVAVPQKFDPRCKVCQQQPQRRRIIERLAIMPNVSFVEIEQTFGIPRRSISNHAKEHLNYEEAAIRRLIEHEASALKEDAEEGVKGALQRRVFMSAYVQRSLEALLNGQLELTAKDALSAIQLQDKLDQMSGGAAIDEINLQFNAFLQAFRELSQYDIDTIKTPFELQALILNRTKSILGKGDEKLLEG